MLILSASPPLIVKTIAPLHKKGMSHLIPLTIIQTAKNIILWSQMVTWHTKNYAISIDFDFHTLMKIPLNQRFSHNLVRRAPP
ncbi:hypothetical protein COF68_16790 [Bacillus toyonensis]|nr:hypothetical protein COE77_29160 [Bacillus toyonensis]PHE61382.1 hypothetical protein COF68_16790 [Bacillus toyonensis]